MSTDNPKNRDPITEEPGSHPVGTGVGALAGVATGAVAGLVAGPVGVIIGSIAGGLAGSLAGRHVGESLNPTEGLVFDDEDSIGTGAGLTTGAIIGGTIGIVGGPLGVAAGAAIGAGIGGYAGREVEGVYDTYEKNKENDIEYVEETITDSLVNSPTTDVKTSYPIDDSTVVRTTDTEYVHNNPAKDL